MQCSVDADCGWHAECTDAGVCEAFPLFTHPVADTVMGITSFFIAGISLAAGVGGGGMFVPLLMMFLSFDARVATALSQSMLLGGAVAAFIYNLDHSHPKVPTRPLVDFQLACLMGPTLMSGAQVGSVVHAVAPPAALLFLLCVVLLDAARKGLANAKKIQAAEDEQKKIGIPEPVKHHHHHHAGQDVMHHKHLIDAESETTSSGSSSEVSDEDEAAARISDAKCYLFFIWLFCVAVVLSKGLLVDICSPQWWALVAGATIVLGCFGMWYARELSQQVPVDEECLDFRELALPLVKWSFLAGILAAVCGIGGGMVMGPILVGLKVPPAVSTATTATTLLVLSSSIALVYICREIAPRDYSIFLSVITTLGALAGKVLIGRWVRRTGKDSVLVWALAGITIASTLLMGGLGIARVYKNGAKAFAFGSLCLSDDGDHHLFSHINGTQAN